MLYAGGRHQSPGPPGPGLSWTFGLGQRALIRPPARNLPGRPP
jgi:hypothetical protein